MSDEGKFQVACGAIIQLRGENKVLLIHRASTEYGGDIWEFPIGRIKQFESFADGLKREVAEETGITSLEILQPVTVFEFMRGEHAAENEVRAVTFATLTDQKDVKLSHEHDAYKWLPVNDAIALADHPGIKHDLQAYSKLSTQ